MFQPSGPGHVLSTTDEIWANTTTSESGVESNPMSNKKVKGDHNLTVGLLRNLVFKNQAPQGLADPLPSSTSSQPSSSLDPSDSPDPLSSTVHSPSVLSWETTPLWLRIQIPTARAGRATHFNALKQWGPPSYLTVSILWLLCLEHGHLLLNPKNRLPKKISPRSDKSLNFEFRHYNSDPVKRVP